MKSSLSNSSKEGQKEGHLHAPLKSLYTGKKTPPFLQKLQSAGINTIEDLLWVLPNRMKVLPPVQDFSRARVGELFQGQGQVLSCQARPSFRARFKSKVTLSNLTLIVKDDHSSSTLHLKWFNAYPSLVNKMRELKAIHFWGEVSEFQNHLQIVNPSFGTEAPVDSGLLIQYPTVNTVDPKKISELIQKIPADTWSEVQEYLPVEILRQRNFLPLDQSFRVLHGKEERSAELTVKAKERLIHHEFFQEQVKIHSRRSHLKKESAPIFKMPQSELNSWLQQFPYSLTEDQAQAWSEIMQDLSCGLPMARMIQGDVGCGKTSLALLAAALTQRNHHQVALMCPTESLAQQHFHTFQTFFAGKKIAVDLLLGSSKSKNEIYERISTGQSDIVIGTHSLLSEGVKFHNLGLTIIDEQHKFGVNQRIHLGQKGSRIHTLIMTATPIPRSLRLTQYGDLDISLIKSLPQNRKPIKTRIVPQESFPQFLNFMKTRLDMKEQAFVVVPAISESEVMDIQNLEKVLERFKKFFPQNIVMGLHGGMKAQEKQQVFEQFSQGKGDILIATSVIEVGINIPQASIMAILNPERFGLSSLHQLRGRVGRGKLPGFCFLLLDKTLYGTSLERVRVIESTQDGFAISEADLKIRGEGDLFGTHQSGESDRKVADLLLHEDILFQAQEDFEQLAKHDRPRLELLMKKLITFDDKVLNTI